MYAMDEGPSENKTLRRIRTRWAWALVCLIAGGGAIYVGAQWLFADAACPRLQVTVLLVCTVSLALFMAVVVFVVRNNVPLWQLSRAVAVFALSLFGSVIVGWVLFQFPQAQAQFCACPDAARIGSLRQAGSMQGAEDLARNCIQVAESLQCKGQCECELAHLLDDRSEALLDAHSCMEASQALTEAEQLASQCGGGNLVPALQARRQAYDLVCGPTPTPTITPTATTVPIILEVLHATPGDTEGIIDVRVLAGTDLVTGLTQEDFSLTVEGRSVPIQSFTERHADDPVCAIAIVDNSGSVFPGLTEIKEAVERLNDARKPGDELGMVLFDSKATLVQVPGEARLPADQIKGTGNLTALWDGIDLGLAQAAANCTSQARYLIVLTDGNNNVRSGRTGDNPTIAREEAQEAQSQNINICTVGVQSTGELDEISLKAVSVGCGYYPAANFEDVADRFQEIFGFVRAFYRITFPADVLTGQTATITLRFQDGQEVQIAFTR